MTIRKKIVLIYLIAIIIPAIIFTFTFRIINDDYKKQFSDFDKREINRSELINKSIINLVGVIIKKDYKLSDSSKEYLDEYLMQLPYGLSIESDFGNYKSKDFNNLRKDEYEITYMDNNYKISISHFNPLVDFQKKRDINNIKMIAIFIIIYIILHILFIKYVLKIILLPLKDMKQFAIEMKKGNYDYLIDYKKDDEIKEVYDAFENMRKRLKESEEINIKYTENRKKLIANIGHDLKTPIAAISGYVDGIVDGVANTPEKFEKYVKIVRSYVSSMENLIDDLFLFSKLDIDKIQFDFKNTNLKNYFEDCIEDIGYDLEEKNIELKYDFNYKNEKGIKIDSEKLKRSITNIIFNSIKHLNKDKKIIFLIVNEIKDGCEVIIKDNGEGIEKNDINMIFNEFYKVDESRNFKGSSGLGLSIVKKIIEAHGGTVKAESEINFGTSIIFTLKFWEEKNEENSNN